MNTFKYKTNLKISSKLMEVESRKAAGEKPVDYKIVFKRLKDRLKYKKVVTN
jgi:hypothetical protein